jgi:hypothetical protein
MAFTKQRFLINPLANKDNTVASSQAAGTVTNAKKTGTGSATMTTSGSYTGANDKLITWQIDSLGTGEIGSSTYRWKTSDTAAGTWEATGQATSTATTTLGSEGVEFTLTGGTGADFALGDKFQWWVYAEKGPGNLFVNDRDLFWESADGDLTDTLTITHGTPTQSTVMVIADHNLTSAATVTLNLDVITTITDPLVHYYDNTIDPDRILIDDPTNPDNHLRIGKLYLGTWTEVDSGQVTGGANWGPGRTVNRNEVRNEAATGKERSRVYTENESFPLAYTWLSQANLATLRSVWDYTSNVNTGENPSIWVHYWKDVDSSMMLCKMIGNFSPTYVRGGSSITLNFRQEVITRIL